jgi:hypothetical protein
MATTDTLGLFATPEQYQAQQAEQERARALQFASMTPLAGSELQRLSGQPAARPWNRWPLRRAGPTAAHD